MPTSVSFTCTITIKTTEEENRGKEDEREILHVQPWTIVHGC